MLISEKHLLKKLDVILIIFILANFIYFVKAFSKNYVIKNISYKKPHSIRDTYTTTLIRRGASIHDVKDLLGHSSIKIIEKYYIFVFPEDKSKTASLLDDIIL